MQFAILVATIIAILLASFLTLTQTHRFFNTQSKILGNVIDSAIAGIRYSLEKEHPIGDSITLESDMYKTSIKKANWGGFLKVQSNASAKTKSFSKMALTGHTMARPELALQLSGDKLPLVLVGNTTIEGDAYVSDLGVKAGIISGNYFNGNELVNGTIGSGKGEFPEMDPIWLDGIRNILEYVPYDPIEIMEREAINKNSFFDSSRFLYDENRIVLNETYIGNIVIKSRTEIVVTPSAHLTDVTLVAPKITIEKGFKGSGSLIASEKITVAENVRFDYPSSLVLINSGIDEQIPVPKGEEPIYIADGSTVTGTVIFLDEREEKENGRMNSFTHIAIAPGGTVKGYVYCQGNVELMGTVMGSVYTHRFLAREFGSVYINHIYNGRILARDLESGFGGLPLKDSDKAIIKWLY
ncbi:MAG TPA: hypothetical protein PKH16_00210 [Aequorivita sp.]|nr:hypothetical protein [Aequorivita sp.]